MKLRFTALLLCAAMMSLIAASCGDTPSDRVETPSVSDDTSVETTDNAPVLPDADFGGDEFTFLNGCVFSWFSINDVSIDEQNGETLNDAIYKRNCIIEERYNVDITEIPTQNAQSDYNKSIAANDNVFDIALLRMEWAMPIVLQNAAVNWNNIPYLNLDREWWVQGSIKDMSLMNNVYFGVSLFDTTHFDSVRTLYFNKQMIEDFNLESPYDVVREGKWTLDKMYEMGMKVAAELNGDGELDNNDRYGFSGQPNIVGNTLMAGANAILSISKDENDIPVFNLDNELSIAHLEKIAKLVSSDDGFVYRKASNSDKGNNLFINNQLLFLNDLVFSVMEMREMAQDFGIIPTPKYDEDQAEYINLGGSPFFMTVPTTNTDLERTGIMMEALSYESMGLVDKAYYDIILKGKVTRDNESSEMLDLIFSTLRYYHPLANSYLNAPLADDYIWNGKTDFASYFASKKSAIESEINTAIETYLENVKE